MAFEDLAFKPPVHAIRVKTCGNDWVTDCDATLTADKVRGFALDSEGVKVYSRERDIHGDYDNIYVPYSNLEALVFYFNEPQKSYTLIPVPSHGRLIDADAFIAEQQHLYCENCERRKGMKNGKMRFVYDIGDAPCRACEIMDVLDSLEDAPTIILASGKEEQP